MLQRAASSKMGAVLHIPEPAVLHRLAFKSLSDPSWDKGGLKARPLGRPGRAFRCPELCLELNWLRLLASNSLLDLLSGPTEV